MTFEKNEIQPETIELRDEIVALDAELVKDFKTQFSVAPYSTYLVSCPSIVPDPSLIRRI